MMFLWIILAVLTAAVAALLLMPFARARRASEDRASEVEVYRDQMKELDRDLAQGLIDKQEAEAARAEIGRRLIAAAGSKNGEASGSPKQSRHGFAKAAVILVPPAIGLCLYIMLGSPDMPDQPLEARLANPGNNVALLVAKVERHLAQNPNDGAGWEVLAPIYYGSQRLADAEMAFRNTIRLLGPAPQRYSGLGETLVAANDGIVTEDARKAFEEAAKLDTRNPRPRFYLGLAHEQAGRKQDALAVFEKIAAESPPNAPWMALVSQHIARNGGTVAAPKLSGPTQEDVAAAANLSQDDRRAMVQGMIDSLAAKLKDDPKNLEGWVRLVRSYSVLGNKGKAAEALQQGLKQFPSSGELVALANEIGIAVEGTAQ